MDEYGVSLIESLLVITILGVIVILLANLPNAMLLINKSKHLSIAREILTKQIEDKRAISFINLVDDESPISDSRMSLLPKADGIVKVESCDPNICANGESIKQVEAIINWQDGSKTQTVTLKTLIGEGGINQ